MIKGVLLDYGGVMADGGKGIDLALRVAAEIGLSADEAKTVIYPLWRQMTRGEVSGEQFWTALQAAIGHEITDEQRHAWDSWWNTELYPEMAAAVAALKENGIQVGLLSNIIPSAAEAIRAAGSYDAFGFTLLSCDVGYAKPDPEIYDLAIAQFKDLQSEEIVFVDDQEKCLPPAQDLGIETILATSSQQVIADLRKLDLPV
jgi:epoxide hydrolase-like predicted phosphatase